MVADWKAVAEVESGILEYDVSGEVKTLTVLKAREYCGGGGRGGERGGCCEEAGKELPPQDPFGVLLLLILPSVSV